MEDKHFYFAVQTECHDDRMHKMCTFTDEENERLSSEAIDDGYGVSKFDLIGFYEKGKFILRSQRMKEMYPAFDWSELCDITDVKEDYLVFGSSSGFLHHANQYVQAMGYCHAVDGWMFVEGFKRKRDCDYITLKFVL